MQLEINRCRVNHRLNSRKGCGMWAIVVKEFRQLRRDRRTVALMVIAPMLLLVVFGYAARFDVEEVATLAFGDDATAFVADLPDTFQLVETRNGDRSDAVEALRRNEAVVAVVGGTPPEILVDGADLFAAQTALRDLGRPPSDAGAGQATPEVEILFNPDLETSAMMIPAIAGMILVFIGMLITSLGVVRERQAGTLEQLAVMPFRPGDVFVGKVAPYFLVSAIDLVLVLAIGVWLFGVPFEGSVAPLALGGLLFLFVALGMGVLVSIVSENQGQAIQLAIMLALPQILLSGMIFPIESMAAGVRWIAYILPLTYFIDISRGVMVRGAPIDSLWLPLGLLAGLSVVVFGLSVLLFRRDLGPAQSTARRREATVEVAP